MYRAKRLRAHASDPGGSGDKQEEASAAAASAPPRPRPPAVPEAIVISDGEGDVGAADYRHDFMSTRAHSQKAAAGVTRHAQRAGQCASGKVEAVVSAPAPATAPHPEAGAVGRAQGHSEAERRSAASSVSGPEERATKQGARPRKGGKRDIAYYVNPLQTRQGCLRRRGPAGRGCGETDSDSGEHSDEASDHETEDEGGDDAPWHASHGNPGQGGGQGSSAKLGKRRRARGRCPQLVAGDGNKAPRAAGAAQEDAAEVARRAEWDRRKREKGIIEVPDPEMGIHGLWRLSPSGVRHVRGAGMPRRQAHASRAACLRRAAPPYRAAPGALTRLLVMAYPIDFCFFPRLGVCASLTRTANRYQGNGPSTPTGGS
jgi:hypothetical protein